MGAGVAERHGGGAAEGTAEHEGISEHEGAAEDAGAAERVVEGAATTTESVAEVPCFWLEPPFTYFSAALVYSL